MTATPGKAPKKEKERKQTPEERMEALRYNHMMYGRTEGELKLAPRKTDYGVSYLKHPKFQALLAAFKKGGAFSFDVSGDGKVYTISTDGSHISFNGKIIFYSRPLNRHEDNLLLDSAALVPYQAIEALVHLVFAVIRSFPELGPPRVNYLNKRFYEGSEALESVPAEKGTNLLLGSFKNTKVVEKPRK